MKFAGKIIISAWVSSVVLLTEWAMLEPLIAGERQLRISRYFLYPLFNIWYGFGYNVAES